MSEIVANFVTASIIYLKKIELSIYLYIKTTLEVGKGRSRGSDGPVVYKI
jgi:hypothetical protein